MPNVRTCAPIFAALGEEVRLRILVRLAAEGSLSIARLAEPLPISRQAVTKHLRFLAAVGLVKVVREGREARWSLTPEGLTLPRSWLDELSSTPR
jgi:DNA-binding transcriptional ArsR family regulator